MAHDKLSKIIDKLNSHFGAGTLSIATEGDKQRWTLRREFLSPGIHHQLERHYKKKIKKSARYSKNNTNLFIK